MQSAEPLHSENRQFEHVLFCWPIKIRHFPSCALFYAFLNYYVHLLFTFIYCQTVRYSILICALSCLFRYELYAHKSKLFKSCR